MRISLDFNSASLMRNHVHGYSAKDMAVLHETVSPDIVGMADIVGVEKYLASKDYGIHGMTDLEGHKAWARGLGSAIFWQCGGVNERSIGIEQVSRVMLQAPTNALRRKLWVLRNKQLRATAKLLACWHNSDQKKHPLVYSNGLVPGVTSHWDVSQHFPASDGHTDCWPAHKGGYYPILEVVQLAKVYAATGLCF
jgi:hypothetical protein